MSAKVDITGWKPVIIGKGRGASRQWIMIGYAGKAKGGQIPLALLDGTPVSPVSNRRGAWLSLSMLAGIKGQTREPTEAEIAARMR